MWITDKILCQVKENFMEIQKLYKNFEKILRKYWEIFTKYIRKGRQNYVEIWNKSYRNFLKVLRKFQKIFYEFWAVSVEIMRNFVVIYRNACGNFTVSKEYLWKLRIISRKFCKNFAKSLKNTCGNYEKIRESFCGKLKKCL